MKIGLVLGGGAAFGFAHVGVLKILEKYGIKPDIIAGTSVGSLIGGILASGMSAAEIEKLALELKWGDITNIVIPTEGLISLDKFEEYLCKTIKYKKIEDMPIKFAVAVTDLIKGVHQVITEGPIDTAIRSSCSLPGIFVPGYMNGCIYVDGGVLDNLPVEAVKDLGAEFIIAVDVLAKNTMELMKHKDIFNIVWRSWQVSIQQQTSAKAFSEVDFMITPQIENIGPFDIYKRKELIKVGEQEGERIAAALLEKMKEKVSIVGKIKRMLTKEL
jgi:NTE family protein